MPFSHSSNLVGSTRRIDLPTATIVRRRDYTDDLFVLWVKPSIEVPFTPGQYVTLGAGGVERAYSVASAPHEPAIELFIEFVLPEHGGKLTPLLYAQHVGEVLSIRPRAKGRFTRRPGVANHVMVATVTGIAPYISMIRAFVHERERGSVEQGRFFVLQGASYRDEFVYDEELRALGARHPNLVQYVPSVSRPRAERNAGWTGPAGRVNLLVEEYLGRWDLRPADTLVYLCGNPGMIEDATARLAPGGWPLLSERFWR